MKDWLRALVERARNSTRTRSEEIKIRSAGGLRSVSIEVIPLRTVSTSRYWLVVFREVGLVSSTSKLHKKKTKKASKVTVHDQERIFTLTRELSETRQYLESLNRDLENTNQDLQSANEEVLSANEELQSTNEELETAKEELQSGNEELTTVNDELQSRNSELDHVNNDLSNLLGAIEIPILMIGRDGRIRRVTPAAQRALSLLVSDIGRPIREMKSNFEVLGLELNLERKVAEVVETMTPTETEIQDQSGHWFRLQVRPYRTLDNRIDGAVIVLVDIDMLKRSLNEISRARTEAEKARESAEAGNRAKDIFLATLSHELRTPLTTILSYSQLLALGKLGPEETKKAVFMIEQSAQSQAQLINDLLDISRIIMGKLALDVQNENPAIILHSAIESVRPLAERKMIRIEEMFITTEIPIRADKIRLKQVFLNLLTNAIKFSESNSIIQVHLESAHDPSGDFIQIRVRDFGKGISATFLPHLFDRFSQADSSSTRVYGGMGLGLAIVRSLTEAQGGSVKAESSGEGKGTTFTLRFPIINREPLAEVPRSFEAPFDKMDKVSKEKEHPSLKGINILLVDDDPGARESVGALLSSFGAIVSVADSAQEAMKILPDVRPDVLISDLAMPGEDGYSLLKRVRKLPSKQFRKVPALAMTAFAGHDDAKRVLASGFQAHLAKPIDASKLARVILEILNSRPK